MALSTYMSDVMCLCIDMGTEMGIPNVNACISEVVSRRRLYAMSEQEGSEHLIHLVEEAVCPGAAEPAPADPIEGQWFI